MGCFLKKIHIPKARGKLHFLGRTLLQIEVNFRVKMTFVTVKGCISMTFEI